MTLEVALKALVADSDRWDAMSQELTGMSGDTASLYHGQAAFSFLGEDAYTAYEELRAFVRDHLTDGSTKIKGAADALDHVHSVYVGTDEAAKAALEAKWKWL